MLRRFISLTPCLALGIAAISATPAAGAPNPALERQFTETVQPFVAQYCIVCHSGDKPASQFNLSVYSSMEAVVEDHPHWALVLGKLKAGEMPPKAMPQPPAEARQQVIDWIEAVRMDEARRNAGDPGPVLARRLSNSEYDYTIRDLTGQDIRPAREFPVDPANMAGFDNSGESLNMSPSLLNKYLQAARDVSEHMVLTPDGIDFSSHSMLVETDREKYTIQRIVEFYENQPTDFADYFQAAWRFKHRAALGKPGATLAGTAADAKLSAKYLPMVWGLLEESPEAAKKEVGPIAKLQAMWRALPAPGKAQPDALRARCVEMRDFVVRIRQHTSMQFKAPRVDGLPGTSQPLLNWKLSEFAAHRRESDPKALRNDTDPPLAVPSIPGYPGLHREAAFRWAALMQRARAGDSDLVVPAAERARYEASFARFASIFPDAFYIKERGRYFPDDSEDKGRFLSAGFHNVMGYFRDDTPLLELILDEKGQKRLNRLWDEFDFIADQTGRTWGQFYFNESGEVQGKGAESGTLRPSDEDVRSPAVIFRLRDTYLAKAQANPANDPMAVAAIRAHFQKVNDTLRRLEQMHKDAEPHHLDALLQFAEHAYRRPLSKKEAGDLRAYYDSLRAQTGLTHEEAVRDSIVSVLMSPYFLYRLDLVDGFVSQLGAASGDKASRVAAASPGVAAKPATAARGIALSAYALASRLSYFLWSSMPDDELLAHAADGSLVRREVLVAQARRMLKDARVRGSVVEFAGNWLDFRRFEQHNAVDRERFPAFDDALREAMFEEPIRFIEDAVQNNRSVLDLIYGDYTFVNPVLARHYGMPQAAGDETVWVRVDEAGRYNRGGLLPMAVFLTQSSPGLRTSPVKRGFWIVHRVLGETIPPPPPVVPELPSDETKSDLPLPQMLAQHRANPVCATCHARFDSFGLAFEGFGPVGERRSSDLAGRLVEAVAEFPGGGQGEGLTGVRDYIREHRQDDFLDNLSRKMLAYALSRTLLLSDEPIIEQARANLKQNNFRFDSLIETIITSPQFLNRRGPDAAGQLSSIPSGGE
jgi:mono/diheme cytochrome c family protein